MSTTRPHRGALANALWSTSTWLLPIVLSFVTTPIVLRYLGTETYGLYVLIQGFVWYSFTFGIGKAATKFVSEFRAADDPVRANEAVSATLLLGAGLGLVGAVAMAACSGVLAESALGVPESMFVEAARSLAIAGAVIFVMMVGQTAPAVLLGLHRFDRHAAIGATTTVLLHAGTGVLAVLGRGVSELLLWNLFTASASALLYFYTLRRFAPEIRLVKSISPPVRRAVFRYGFAIILTQIFGNALLLIERAWISRNLGVDNLAYYALPMTLGLFLHAFVSSIVVVIFPLLNESLADPERAARIYRTSTKFVLVIAAFASVSSVFLGHDILTLWVGPEVADRSAFLLAIHMATFAVLAFGTVSWNVAESFGVARATVWFTFGWLVVSVVLMPVLGHGWGLAGIAAARLSGAVGILGLAFFVEARILRCFSWRHWALALARLGGAALGLALVQWLCSAAGSAALSLAAGLLVGGAVFLGGLVVLRFFDADEMGWLSSSVRRLGFIS